MAQLEEDREREKKEREDAANKEADEGKRKVMEEEAEKASRLSELKAKAEALRQEKSMLFSMLKQALVDEAQRKKKEEELQKQKEDEEKKQKERAIAEAAQTMSTGQYYPPGMNPGHPGFRAGMVPSISAFQAAKPGSPYTRDGTFFPSHRAPPPPGGAPQPHPPPGAPGMRAFSAVPPHPPNTPYTGQPQGMAPGMGRAPVPTPPPSRFVDQRPYGMHSQGPMLAGQEEGEQGRDPRMAGTLLGRVAAGECSIQRGEGKEPGVMGKSSLGAAGAKGDKAGEFASVPVHPRLSLRMVTVKPE
eukprot:CAMPEP_0184303200 /NCGR_PEP_ID=MMETSP1049-20130417/12991_1 /TAXON_ID=77928 /ORGANISM="Proteomonas sulcata, Strain CCMP704" /LENGTH=301 /DNA_ID=CAMNT_0026614669 /DNA_START=90 /DNA_END=993 /DNA_ORIENTATION=+